jgi:aryl-alcohol dehydrogenase-like predicted oxidoreductase
MEAGILFTETSESYGLKLRPKSLSAEHILCQCIDSNTNAQPIIASGMSSPIQSLTQGTGLRLGQDGVTKAIEGSNGRLGSSSIDLYYVPTRIFYPGPPGILATALSNAMDSGLINNVGISTLSKGSMKRFNKKLNDKSGGGYQLTSNAFEFSLVNRKAWKSGLIDACKQEGIIPIARNPLGDGLASGVWTATNPTGGEVSKKQPFDFKTLDKYATLHSVLENVQKKVQTRLEKQNKELTDRRNRYRGKPVSTKFHHFLC